MNERQKEERAITWLQNAPNSSNKWIAASLDLTRERVIEIRANLPAQEVWEGPSNGTYFIADEQGHVKIGRGKDVHKRLKNLQVGNVQKLTILAVSNEDEGELHIRFADYHVRGEWFELSEAIQEYIDQLND